MGERPCNGDFSFLPMPLVSSVNNQSKLPKSLLVGDQCLDRVMFFLKSFGFILESRVLVLMISV